MQKFKFIFLLITIPFLISFQSEELSINVNTMNPELSINDSAFIRGSHINSFISAYGPASRQMDGSYGSQLYVFENYGMVVRTSDGIIRNITLTFFEEGDSSYAQPPFTGTFVVNSVSINAKSSVSDLKKIEGIECPDKSGCVSTNYSGPMGVIATFDKGGRLKNVSLHIDKK